MRHNFSNLNNEMTQMHSKAGIFPTEDRSEIKEALQYHQAGKIEKAEAIYKKILDADPDHGDALCYMGVIALKRGMPGVAEGMIRGALRTSPGNAVYHNNLGVALNDQGLVEDAITCYYKALTLAPYYAEASYNLGKAFRDLGELDRAIEFFKKAVEINPDFVNAYNSMGVAFSRRGRQDEAIACFRNALEIDSNNNALAYNNMGNALREQGKLDQAVACFRNALEINPHYARAYNNMGVVLNEQNKVGEALCCFNKALEMKQGKLDVFGNLGATYQKMGKVDEAIGCHRKALELRPGDAVLHSNLIFSLHYDPEISGEELLAECRRWDLKHGTRFQPQSYENIPDPERRLKIGYFSADFRGHAAGILLEPLLSIHDKTVVEVFCYAEVGRPDAFTERFKKHADYWRSTVGFSDKELAERIRADGIDILVDCTGYSNNNRLTALALKPAPVQISTLIGHGGATGLDAFDYVMSDKYITPPGFEEHFKEKIIRLPHHVAPFRPIPQWPEVSPLPAEKTGRVVFGCFASPARISRSAIFLWRRILEQVPESGLILKNPAFTDSETRKFWQDVFPSSNRRITFEDVPGGWGRNMDIYSRVDIVLDSLPFGGHTSSMIPLWMGVPVIGLFGRHAAHRKCGAVLSSVGLLELLAETEDEYVEKAVVLAKDIDSLKSLRKSLRRRMASSPLCNSRQICADIESAYRSIWREWCNVTMRC